MEEWGKGEYVQHMLYNCKKTEYDITNEVNKFRESVNVEMSQTLTDGKPFA